MQFKYTWIELTKEFDHKNHIVLSNGETTWCGLPISVVQYTVLDYLPVKRVPVDKVCEPCLDFLIDDSRVSGLDKFEYRCLKEKIQNAKSQSSLQELTLDPNHPVEAKVIELMMLMRKKRADYAKDDNPFSNFEYVAKRMGIPGFGPREAILVNIYQKEARLEALKENGRMDEIQNESVYDTYEDLANYWMLLVAYEKRKHEG